MIQQRSRVCGMVVAALLCAGGAAQATSLDVTITNTQAAGGLYLTPFLTVFHDGTYDAFDAGAAPSAGVEAIAEDGNTAVEMAAIGTSNTRVVNTVTAPGGFPGAPVLDPGESTTLTLALDPIKTRFFSFLSMVIPSNDNFIGNDNATAYEIFDAGGMRTSLDLIEISASQVWDAGTELNDGFGAPFSSMGGTATDTNDGITLQPSLAFLTTILPPPGVTINNAPSGQQLLATIQFAPTPVPLPATLPLVVFGLAGMMVASRRKRAA